MRATSVSVLVSQNNDSDGLEYHGNTQPVRTHDSSAELNGPETPVFTGFQAQKKTSVDVFR